MATKHINMTGTSGLPILVTHQHWGGIPDQYSRVDIVMAFKEDARPVEIRLECPESMVQPLLASFLANVEVAKLIK